MDYQQVFAIGAAGMALERARLEAALSNLARANTPLDPAQPAYAPRRVVGRGFCQQVEDALQAPTGPVAIVQATGAAHRLVAEPGHPLADAQGFVHYPGVDTATETFNLMRASRAYDASVGALRTARDLALKTLEIGR